MSDPVASTSATAGTAGKTAAATPLAKTDQDKLKAAAKQFEAIFLRQMLGSMRSASLGDGVFDSDESKQFQDMSDGKLADQMANKGTLHIADMLIKQYGARLSGSAAAGGATTAAATGAAATGNSK